jgi:hypothetical protein
LLAAADSSLGTGSLARAFVVIATGRRRAPLARTTATPTAVVNGTARTSPIEPTRIPSTSAANCSVINTSSSGRLLILMSKSTASEVPAVANAMVYTVEAM